MKLIRSYNDPMFNHPLMFNLSVYYSDSKELKIMVSDVDMTGTHKMVSISSISGKPVSDKDAQEVCDTLGIRCASELCFGSGSVRKFVFSNSIS